MAKTSITYLKDILSKGHLSHMFAYKHIFYCTKYLLFFYKSPKEIKDIKPTETSQLGTSITIQLFSFFPFLILESGVSQKEVWRIKPRFL